MNCIGNTKDCKPCRSRAQAGSEFCFFHDPASVQQRRAAQTKGGSNRSHLELLPAPLFEVDLEDPRKIAKLLTYIAKGVLRGQFEIRMAYAVGYLADCALRTRNAGEMAERLAELERLVRIEHASSITPPVTPTVRFLDEDQPAESEIK